MGIQKVDALNLALLIVAGLLAVYIPFELLLISYAFLGPLHYLTEISWLHDKNYFSIHKIDGRIITISSLVILYFGAAVVPESSELVWILLIIAFCAAFIRSWWQRLSIILLGTLLILPLLGSTASYALSVLIPTVVHVFLFTFLFMLQGALRSGSLLGYINAGLFVIGAALLVLLPFEPTVIWSSYVQTNYVFFSSISDAVATILGFDSAVILTKMASFLAFAYTYHYLNWFSKTSIIEWHRVSPVRAGIIGFLYMVAVGLYLTDYALGLTVLLSLSFLHVILELPLNFKSIQSIHLNLVDKVKK